MTFEGLQLFVRAAKLGGLAAAGRVLGLSPAAASARLTTLEKSLGATLMTRTTRRITLTEDGQAFLPFAERALQEAEAGRDALGGAAEHPTGILRASLPAAFGESHILPFLPEFRGLYPELRLDLHFSDDLVDLVGGGFDLGVRIGVLADSALIARKLCDNRRLLVASPDFIARHGAPNRPEDLAHFETLALPVMLQTTFVKADETVAIRMGGALQTNSGSVIRMAAIQGLGVAVKSIWDVGADLQEGRLVRLLPEWRIEGEGAIWALRPPGSFVPARSRALIDFLAARYGPEPYWETGCL